MSAARKLTNPRAAPHNRAGPLPVTKGRRFRQIKAPGLWSVDEHCNPVPISEEAKKWDESHTTRDAIDIIYTLFERA